MQPFPAPLRPALLTVLAHPDDESFGMGGTLAYYAWCGVATHLICATGGEEGDVAAEYLVGYASKQARRQAELECAAAALGLHSLELFGYRDSGMPNTPANSHPDALAAQPLDAVAARITHAIRRHRPQVVVTFDPIGGYRHPDHIAIQRATVAAFHAAADPMLYPSDLPPYAPQKLYFQTFPRDLLRLVVRLLPLFGRDPRRFGRNNDVDLAALAEVDFPIHARIDTFAVRHARDHAVACHASQGGSLPKGPLGQLLSLIRSTDTYMRAYPPAPIGLRERDLFADVNW